MQKTTQVNVGGIAEPSTTNTQFRAWQECETTLTILNLHFDLVMGSIMRSILGVRHVIGHMVIVGCPEYEFGHGSVRTTHCGD